MEKENDSEGMGRRMEALYESERLTRQSRPYTVALVTGPVEAHHGEERKRTKNGEKEGGRKGGCDVRG